MTKHDEEIINLDGQDTDILNKKGWFLATYYQSREGGDGSNAYNRAIQKANTLARETGLRSYVKDNYTYWEVWEHW